MLTKNNPRVKVGDAQGWSNVTAWTIGWRRWRQWNWWAWEGTRAQGARPSSPQLPKSRFVFIFQSSFNNSSCIILQIYVLFCNYRGLRHLCWSSMTAAESRLSKIFLSLFCPNEPLFIEKQWPSTPPALPHLPTHPFQRPLVWFPAISTRFLSVKTLFQIEACQLIYPIFIIISFHLLQNHRYRH